MAITQISRDKCVPRYLEPKIADEPDKQYSQQGRFFQKSKNNDNDVLL